MSHRCLITSCLLVCLLAHPAHRACAADDGELAANRGESRDVILLLDSGPLHLRFYITLGGQPLAALRDAYVDRLIAKLDADQDGRLTRDETARSPLLRKKQRPKAREFLKSLGQAQVLSRRDIAQAVARQAGELVVYRENKNSSANDNELFAFLDSNGDGLLDSRELLSTGKRVLEKDSDGDENVSFAELLPEPEPVPPEEMTIVQPAQPSRPSESAAMTMLRDTRHIMLAKDMVRRYDRNRDRGLSQTELAWTTEPFDFLDENGDARLDATELKFIHQAPPDLELAVDLDPGDEPTEAVRVISANGKQLKSTSRPDFCRIEFQGAVVTFARRYLDPFVESIDNAMIEFNAMDADANGYLDEVEAADEIRLSRGGFEMIDADGDGKLFAEEMEQFIRVYTEPIASTCRVKMYDTGYGFFMALDANGDGRIGLRERRQAQRSLELMDRDGTPGVSRREPVRHFHVEFVRGSYRMFGSMNESTSEVPAFQQRSEVGPVWFRRMDRNGDGDLSWGEFLGRRDVFHRLDADHDGLIDAMEAVAAKDLARPPEEPAGE